jgi:hypothetical protein
MFMNIPPNPCLRLKMSSLQPSMLLMIRQNHAIEHATMHILARRNPQLHLLAHSDWAGFTIYGEVSTEAVIEAVTEGLLRLRQGESSLAIHPRCGTNLAIPLGISGGLLLTAVSMPVEWRFTRFTLTLLAGVVLAIRKPLSLAVQRHLTTTSDVQDVRVRAIQHLHQQGIPIHRVLLGS